MEPQYSAHPGGGSTGTVYMLGQSSYPSLYRSTDEVPQFFLSYRWWEDEATTVLWAFDVLEIKRAIRFGLFRDQNLPRTALQSRDHATIDSFLFTLVAPHERLFVANLSHTQKVEEIIRRCRKSTPPRLSWEWFPLQKERDLDPLVIAEAIDTESHLHFTRISFEELVRFSLGYSSAMVEWFLQQHTAFYVHLLDYLNSFPEEVMRYKAVEEHLRTRSPFAHRAVVSCLFAIHGGSSQVELPNTRPGFEFIAGPIQRLFRDLPPSLTTILRVLLILDVRFQRTYVHSRVIDWNRPFNVAFSFVEDLLGSTSPTDFANTLTGADIRDFSALCEQDTFEESVAYRLAARWEVLSIDVWECCMALPDNIPYIQECVQALLDASNYHSFTAVLNGLHKYSISDAKFVSSNNPTSVLALNTVLPPDMLYLLDPFQNYAAYRQRFQGSPGIPFLIPHLKEYQIHGGPALQGMLQLMKSAISSE